MPASRWNSSLIDILRWSEEDEAGAEEDGALRELMFSPITTHVVQKDESSEEEAPAEGGDETRFPSVLPILPLRGLVVYPQTAVPLTIGQPRSPAKRVR